MYSSGKGVEGGWDPSEKSVGGVLLATFSPKEASQWGYSLGFYLPAGL